jgi:hypothetical protein
LLNISLSDLYRRYLTIVLDGMRADQGPLSKLPVSALTVGETPRHHHLTDSVVSEPGHLAR